MDTHSSGQTHLMREHRIINMLAEQLNWDAEHLCAAATQWMRRPIYGVADLTAVEAEIVRDRLNWALNG